VEEQSVRVGHRLLGDLDLEYEVGRIGPSFVVKGMFFASLVDGLPPGAWDELAPRLAMAPRNGRYLPFKDYLQSDYLRITVAVAQHRFPGVGMREAIRRLARQDFDVFKTSTFGKVILTLVRDARGALLKVPLVYEKIAPGDYGVRGSEPDEGVVRIEFERYPRDWAYTVGQLEGIVLHYGSDPEVTIRELSPDHMQFDVRHGG
jgi:uncharacterized protein (TIGR02265 family)